MIQAQAHNTLRDLHQDIARRGYNAASKNGLANLFNALKLAASKLSVSEPHVRYNLLDGAIDKPRRTITNRQNTVSEEIEQNTIRLPRTLAELTSLEKKWQSDRNNKSQGCDTIEAILRSLENYIHILPTVVKDTATITIPSKQEQDAKNVVAELRRLGMLVHA